MKNTTTQIISQGKLVDVTPAEQAEARRAGTWFSYTAKRMNRSHAEAIAAMTAGAAKAA